MTATETVSSAPASWGPREVPTTALLTDLHANREALEACLADARRAGATRGAASEPRVRSTRP